MTTHHDDRFQRAVRALVDSPARSLLVGGLSHASQRFPGATIVQETAARTQEALSEEGTFETARLRFGPKLLVDTRDPDAQQLLFGGEIEAPTTRLFERVAWEGWTFADVGSSTGYFALLAHHLGGPGAHVRAFEADQVSADMIRDAAAGVHSGDALMVFHAAVGAREETRYTASGPEMVTTLDAHCDTHGLELGAVRLRADGLQLEALEGMRGQLRSQAPRYVVCSGGWRDDAGAVERCLSGYGYTPNRIAPDGELLPGSALMAEAVCFTPAG